MSDFDITKIDDEYFKDKLPEPEEPKTLPLERLQAIHNAVINSSKEDLKIGIKESQGFIIISFSRPIQFMKLSKKAAREFAGKIATETL